MGREHEIVEMAKSVHYAFRTQNDTEQLEKDIVAKLTADGYRKADIVRRETLTEACGVIKKLAESAHEQRIICERIPGQYETAAYWSNAEKRYWDAYVAIDDLITV